MRRDRQSSPAADSMATSTVDSISVSGPSTKPEMKRTDVNLVEAVGGLALDAATNDEVRTAQNFE